jgi:hypothetical protein
MSAFKVLGAVLVGAWLSCTVAFSQEYQTPRYPTYDPSDVPAPADAERSAAPASGLPHACGGTCALNTGLSDWITYRRDDGCVCAPANGKHLQVEVYWRTGISTPVGGGLLNDELNPGWRIEGGGRSLWFEPSFTRAWTIDAHILNVHNGGDGRTRVPLSLLVVNDQTGNAQRVNFGQGGIPGVTIAARNRTMVGLGVGREYYLLEPANVVGNLWRIGWDFGGRYGSEKMDFNEIRHRTRVLENMFAAAHTDLEFPCCGCMWSAGFRLEWSYTWSTILQTQHDMQDINTLFTFGVRY